jgi:hypothetical protein
MSVAMKIVSRTEADHERRANVIAVREGAEDTGWMVQYSDRSVATTS